MTTMKRMMIRYRQSCHEHDMMSTKMLTLLVTPAQAL
jgi:hypothetical protein